MKKYIFYPKGINDYERKFNSFIESNPWIEIKYIDLSCPLVILPEKRKVPIVASIVYL